MNNLLIEFLESQLDLPKEEILELSEHIPVVQFKKGDILIHQGEIPSQCFFVLQGMIRQFSISQEGIESTSEFYIEEEMVTIFNQHKEDKASKFSLICVEDVTLIVGDLNSEEEMYDQFSVFAKISMNILQKEMGKLRESYADFMALSPEARYKNLIQRRPELIHRVPQHLLASYLGVKPESLSRIKKRIKDA